ncbi:MAG: SAF domain-containing protein [Nocardioidaceae bacterium]
MTSALRVPRADRGTDHTDQTTPVPGGRPGSPPATRAGSRRLRDPRLVVGIVLVALAALAGARLLGDDGTVGVWVARADLRAGEPVTAGDLERREVRFASQADADGYLSADALPASGTVLSRDVGAGELIPRAAVAGRDRAPVTEVPLTVETLSVPATVQVGSRVDVWVAPDAGVTGSDGAGTGRATLVFDDVPVVAAPRGGSSLGPSATRQLIVGIAAGGEADLPTALALLRRGAVLVTRPG